MAIFTSKARRALSNETVKSDNINHPKGIHDELDETELKKVEEMLEKCNGIKQKSYINVIVLKKDFIPKRVYIETMIKKDWEFCSPYIDKFESDATYRIYYEYNGREIFCYVDEETYNSISVGDEIEIKVVIKHEEDTFAEWHYNEYHSIEK